MHRIVFLLDGLKVGGAQRHTIDLAARLLKNGLDVRILLYMREISILAVTPEILDRCTFLDYHRVFDPRGVVAVASELRRIDADIVVAVNQSPTILAALARLMGLRGRFISILHTTILIGGSWDIRRFWLYRLALLTMDGLIFVSRNQAGYWRRRLLYCRRTWIIPNGVDVERFSPSDPVVRDVSRKRLGFTSGDFVIGVCATFRKEKNHSQLVEALNSLIDRGIPGKILFLGDGETRTEVEERVRNLDLVDRVIFVGAKSDVRPLLAAIDVGVVCSNAVETFSIAALEIMAMGIPMVMSDIGGASEIVRDKFDGALFPANNTVRLTEALVPLADHDVRHQAGSRARRGIVERYAYHVMAERYQSLFECI